MAVGDPVYRTTNTVKCKWCGAEPGEDCHLAPGQWSGFGQTQRYHTIRVDPTSEPIGQEVEGPPDSPFIWMESNERTD